MGRRPHRVPGSQERVPNGIVNRIVHPIPYTQGNQLIVLYEIDGVCSIRFRIQWDTSKGFLIGHPYFISLFLLKTLSKMASFPLIYMFRKVIGFFKMDKNKCPKIKTRTFLMQNKLPKCHPEHNDHNPKTQIKLLLP